MIWNDDILNFERREEFVNILIKNGNREILKSFDLFYKLSLKNGVDNQPEALSFWNKLNVEDGILQLIKYFKNNINPNFEKLEEWIEEEQGMIIIVDIIFK